MDMLGILGHGFRRRSQAGIHDDMEMTMAFGYSHGGWFDNQVFRLHINLERAFHIGAILKIAEVNSFAAPSAASKQ